MDIIQWKDEYNTNIPIIDQHHRKMASMINDFYSSVKSNENNLHIKKTLDALIDYTKYHFAYEEMLFEKFDYNEKIGHVKAHIDLKGKIIEYREKIESSTVVSHSEVLGFLIDWFISHITKMDTKYVTFFAEKNIEVK